MEVQGKIKLIGDTQTIGTNNFRKRELVIVTAEQYPQSIQIEFIQDKVEELNNFQVGQDVIVHINIRGREWTNPQGEVKYFNSLQGWRIQVGQNAAAGQTAQANVTPKIPAMSDSTDGSYEDDDLPF